MARPIAKPKSHLTVEEQLLADHLNLFAPDREFLKETIIATKKKAIATKFTDEKTKRYRLHKKCKSYVRLFPKQRLMTTADVSLQGVPDKSAKAIRTLIVDYGYSLQSVII